MHRLWPLCRRGFCVVSFVFQLLLLLHVVCTETFISPFLIINFVCLYFFFFFYIFDPDRMCGRGGAAYCEGRDTLENLCSMIPGDAQQYSLFRRDAAPVECPFRGSYTFTYSRGHGECRSPVSRLDSCTESWRTFFRYQACPDVQGTESSGKMKAATTKLEFIAVEISTHSFMRRKTCPAARPGGRRRSKVSPFMKLSFRTMSTRTGLACVFQLLIGQEGTKRRRPTNLF